MAENLSDEMIDQMAGEAASKSLIAQAAPAKGSGIFDRFVKPTALPMAGGLVGTAVGTRFGGIPGGVVGGGVGSGLGEAANQLLGITEPSLMEVGKATAIPMAIGGAFAAARPLMPFITSGRAAQTLNALAPDEAAGKLAAMAPKVKASALFDQATKAQVLIPMNRTALKVEDLIDELSNVSSGVKKANSVVLSYLKGLREKIITSPGGLTPQALQRELEGVGKVVSKAKATGGQSSGSAQQAFKSMVNDLDDVIKTANPASGPAQTLRLARDTFKKESVFNELKESIEGATKHMRGQGDFVQFNASAVLNTLKKDAKGFYHQALSAQEQGEVESLLKLLNKIPALRPGAGSQFGSGRAAQMIKTGTIGGGFGAATGDPMNAAIGAAIGTAVPAVAEFGKNVATALQMSTGRALMKELLTQSKGVATPQVASIIAAYARAVEANPELGQ